MQLPFLIPKYFFFKKKNKIKTNSIAYKNPGVKNISNNIENIKDLNVNNMIDPEDITSSVVNTEINNNSRNLIFII